MLIDLEYHNGQRKHVQGFVHGYMLFVDNQNEMNHYYYYYYCSISVLFGIPNKIR